MKNLEARQTVGALIKALETKDTIAYSSLFEGERTAEEWKRIAGAALLELHDFLRYHRSRCEAVKEALWEQSILDIADLGIQGATQDAAMLGRDVEGLEEYFQGIKPGLVD